MAFSSPGIIRIAESKKIRWTRHVARMERRMNACRLLVGKSEGMRPLGRLIRRWVNTNEIAGWLLFRLGTTGRLLLTR
jgi:hypothetical protein